MMSRNIYSLKSAALFAFSALSLLIGTNVSANFTYEGTLVDPAGAPVTGTVVFNLKILSNGAEECILFQENQTVSMTNPDGYFSLNVGSGTPVSNNFTLNRVFQNIGNFPALNCASGTNYTPAPSDIRRMRVSINPNGSGAVVLGTLSLNSVPMAESAHSLSGFEPQHLLRAVDGSGNPQPMAALTPALVVEFNALLAGTSNQYLRGGANGTSVPSVSGMPGSPVPGSLWFDNSSQKLKYWNGMSAIPLEQSLGGSVTNVNAGMGLIGGPITNSGTLSVNVGTMPNQIPQLDGMGRLQASVMPDSVMNAAWTSASGDVVRPTGSVGIGMGSAPSAKLDVMATAAVAVNVGSSMSASAISFKNSTSTMPNPTIGMEGDNFFVRNMSASAESMRITPNGRLGLGTATPGAQLHVASQTSTAAMVKVSQSTGDASGPGFAFLKSRGTLGAPQPVAGTDKLGSLMAQGMDPSMMYWSGAQIDFLVDGTPAPSSIPGAITFSTANSGTLAEHMRITSNGNIGIGTIAPAYKLQVVGVAALSSGTAWTMASDRRLKDIQGDYEYGLEEIIKLHTVRFNYKKGNALNLPSDVNNSGFIAQEVQKVIPDAVRTRDDGYLEVNVDPIHWAVVNAVKELYEKWFADHEEIQTLKAENALLKEWICEKDPSAKVCK